MNFEKVSKYDTVIVDNFMNVNVEYIDIVFVKEHNKVEYFPECCPEYMSEFKYEANNNVIIEKRVDMSKRRNPYKTVLHLL